MDEATDTVLQAYLDALLIENQKINLTAIRDAEQARVLHIQDSSAIDELDLAVTRAMDLGSGNGFPGVVVAALFPGVPVTLIDRTGKKLKAIERILASRPELAELSDQIDTVHLDAGQVRGARPDLCGAFDLVTARAVSAPETAAAWARPFLCSGGSLVLWLDQGQAMPDVDGYRQVKDMAYQLPQPAARQRRLVVLSAD